MIHYGFPTDKHYIWIRYEICHMKTNLRQSPILGHIVDDITQLRQRFEYFERHIQTRNQEVRNEYNQALSKVMEAERAIHHFAKVFNNSG
jgi:hypothetical protein